MASKVSATEVLRHATPDDCWIVINGKVYDLTSFAPSHPGGAQMIYQWAGKDGSKTYNLYHTPSQIQETLKPADKKGDFDQSSVNETWLSNQGQELPSETGSEDWPPLPAIINLEDFEKAFARFGSAKSHAYISSASNDLLTRDANAKSWQKLWFRPRIMRNVAQVRTKAKVLGCDLAMPLIISPMGIAKTAGPEGEAALGRGAANTGIIHCISTTASLSVEEALASAPEQPWFFQLYVDKERKNTEAILKKINGMKQIKAIFVTVDLAVVSKREADERIKNQVVYTSQQKSDDKRGGGLARRAGSFIDSGLSWKDIAWLRKHTDRPIVVKGIQGAADAKLAMDMGCDGIVVSNHGGRALDNAPPTVAVLLELRRDCPEVFTRMEVLVDGGIRRGSDILKAVCIGAKAVGIGRPFQCAVAYGTDGVQHCAEIVLDELETAMRLCGVTDLNEIRGDMRYLNPSELEKLLPAEREQYKPLASGWRFWSKL